ncbi:MAG: ribonuclease R [Deltaproteobacteria bacterium]|nr:ribonuclease R [Deltaproteobacteria bacterium]
MSRRTSSEKPGVKRRRTSNPYRETILQFLAGKSTRPLLSREISEALQVPPDEKGTFTRALNALVRSGSVIRIKGGRYALPSRVHLVTGTIHINSVGKGILVPEDNTGEVAVPPTYLNSAMHGDRVIVRVERPARHGRPLGRVIRIVDRAHQQIVAYFEKAGDASFGRPYDIRLGREVIIPKGSEGKALPGQMVVVEITRYPERGMAATGAVMEILGYPDDPGSETMAVVHTFKIPHRFPNAAVKSAAAITGPIPRGSLRKREDLRDLDFVTIDGTGAKDFDDALYATRATSGVITLFVAIADVSHFVRTGSPPDREALRRGNSVYFPDMVIPMLPERLSNDLCSLKPHVDRLTFTCRIEVDRAGNLSDHRLFPGVIRSAARLTYIGVENYFNGNDGPDSPRGPVAQNLDCLHELFERLVKRRRDRNSLDFDLPEPEVVLDSLGHVENIYRSNRYTSHKVVEECMLLANEVVARILRESDSPGIYRIHEPPDEGRIEELNHLLAALGYHVPSKLSRSPQPFKRILEDSRGSVRERFLNTVILRSMMRAQYSTVPSGHFGLALGDYTHFTSPIRRYADLMVHRILKGIMEFAAPVRHSDLENICAHVTETEHIAESAERDILSLFRARFMENKVGQEFSGVISGITTFGFFVELQEFFVEGLVHLSSLNDDYYHFNERELTLIGEHTGRIFRIGDPVTARVIHVDASRRHIDFETV